MDSFNYDPRNRFRIWLSQVGAHYTAAILVVATIGILGLIHDIIPSLFGWITSASR
jgi:hypothetical protein